MRILILRRTAEHLSYSQSLQAISDKEHLLNTAIILLFSAWYRLTLWFYLCVLQTVSIRLLTISTAGRLWEPALRQTVGRMVLREDMRGV